MNFNSFVLLGWVVNATAQMKPGGGVKEWILILLISDYQLAVHIHSANLSLAANKTAGFYAQNEFDSYLLVVEI